MWLQEGKVTNAWDTVLSGALSETGLEIRLNRTEGILRSYIVSRLVSIWNRSSTVVGSQKWEVIGSKGAPGQLRNRVWMGGFVAHG